MATAARTRYATQRPRNDAYVGLLGISLLALIVSCILLYLDYDQYKSQKPENMPRISRTQSGTGLGSAPSEPAPAPMGETPMGETPMAPMGGAPMGPASAPGNPMVPMNPMGPGPAGGFGPMGGSPMPTPPPMNPTLPAPPKPGTPPK